MVSGLSVGFKVWWFRWFFLVNGVGWKVIVQKKMVFWCVTLNLIGFCVSVFLEVEQESV